MQKSLFHKDAARSEPPTPYELIEPEIVHLKKGYSIRHGKKAPKRSPLLVCVAFLALAWLYLMDPILHAWYKGDAVNAFLYLHQFGNRGQLDRLVESRMFSSDEISTLLARQGKFQDYFSSPVVATEHAEAIEKYMDDVRALHAGKYQGLDPIGRMRYLLFIRTGLILPQSWTFLDPSVGE